MSRKTRIISLYGGPGCGKSTAAAYLFTKLKLRGASVEMVQEYVKSWIWDGRTIKPLDQLYLFAKQARAEAILLNKVDFVITDSPVLMSSYYATQYGLGPLEKAIQDGVKAYYEEVAGQGHEHLHVFLARKRPYIAEGRYQAEADAKRVDEGVWNVLRPYRVIMESSETDDLDSLLTRPELS